MTATPRPFNVNDRVRIKFTRNPAEFGTVRGFSRDGRVRVQRDGKKTVVQLSPARLERAAE